ncbi:MAG: hypothetical protein GY861_26155 [bacterium]|nr:hypothetical protein [bacterium]
MDPGLLNSRSLSVEEKKFAERDLLQEEQKRRPEDKEVQNGSEHPFCLELSTDSFIAQAASTELIVVPDFSGDKCQFEHWLQQMHFYLTSTKLIHGDEKVLKHFLLSHLKLGSPPFIIISSERKRRSKVSMKPMTFFEKIILLHKTYEEEENAQKALMKVDQIKWDGHSYTLDKQYADIKFVWIMISPEVDLKSIRAREMLRIITERNFKLGAYLQEQLDRKLLQLDDHSILKESEAWLDRDTLVHSSLQQSENSAYLKTERTKVRYRSF